MKKVGRPLNHESNLRVALFKKISYCLFRLQNSDDEAPNVDDKQFQAPPPIKKLRIPTNNPGDDSDPGGKKKDTLSPTATPTKTAPKTPGRGNGKKRVSQESPPAPGAGGVVGGGVGVGAEGEGGTPQRGKGSKGKLMYNGEHYECSEPNCEKKYKNKNGLSYHIRTAHPTKTDCDGSGKVRFPFPLILFLFHKSYCFLLFSIDSFIS